jgi:ATP/maltotriose-dependent transcriptional regulator MalT/two-component SAPR family response regulator
MVDQTVTDGFTKQQYLTTWQGLLKTRFNPPRQQTRLLERQRVDTLLSGVVDFPLSLLTAPAGSGKTTAMAGFAQRCAAPLVWCRMTADDEPLSLLCHLVAAFRGAGILNNDAICDTIITARLHKEDHASAYPHAVLDLLVNELSTVLRQDTVLVLDDYHQIDQQPNLRSLIERLISIQPKHLHLVLMMRYQPLLKVLSTLRARGEVYQLEQADLAFTSQETQELFDLYDRTIYADVQTLTTLCRGLPLVLQMLAGHSGDCPETNEQLAVPDHTTTNTLDPKSAEMLTSCLERINPLLDDYLTQHVFDEQPPELQDFLLRTAGLRWFDTAVGKAIPMLEHVVGHYQEVRRRNLFLEAERTDHFRYQPLFQMFLDRLAKQRLNDWQTIHKQAAGYFRQRNDWESMIYHLLEIDDTTQAVAVLQQIAPTWLHQGRALALLTWIARLPEAQKHQPELLEAKAAAYRQMGRFDQALRVYEQAEAIFQARGDVEGQARTLRGRAEVYLDTVQPAPAEALLEQALSLLPADHRIARAEILLLQAENWANRGRADIAFQLEVEARNLAKEEQATHAADEVDELVYEGEICPITLYPQGHVLISSPSLPPRLLLRSGRLNESRQLLETALGLQDQTTHESRATILAHREPLLLLALLYAMLGNGARAFAMAMRGLLEALQSGSQLTEAIAHMRVGHAHQVITPIGEEAARQHYEQSLELVQSFGVTRTKVEGYMGLVLLHGHSGDLVQADMVAQEGLKIADAAGDEWIAALILLALGGAAVAANDKRALIWLDDASERFVRGGDTYGQAVVALWRAIHALHADPKEKMQHEVETLIQLAQTYGYEGLLTAPTLYGPRDMAMLIPVLLKGRSLEPYATYAQQLLRQAFPTVAADETVEDYHPGYTLRIQMLGSFRVWRGASEVHSREWQREKARQLLQLLLTYRGQWIQREQICAWLWPDSDLDASERQFKVTLNALNTALEPYRPPRTSPFFVRRQGLAYSFAPSYGCWIDVDEFELRTTNVPSQSDPEFVLRNAQMAVSLYKGDYLTESLYDSWTLEERERLLARYLATATALAERLLAKGDMQQAIQVCEQVLRRDRCYEETYQVLMRTYARSGSRSQALRSYERCVHALQDDMGIEPLPETTELYTQIKQNEKV